MLRHALPRMLDDPFRFECDSLPEFLAISSQISAVGCVCELFVCLPSCEGACCSPSPRTALKQATALGPTFWVQPHLRSNTALRLQ